MKLKEFPCLISEEHWRHKQTRQTWSQVESSKLCSAVPDHVPRKRQRRARVRIDKRRCQFWTRASFEPRDLSRERQRGPSGSIDISCGRLTDDTTAVYACVYTRYIVHTRGTRERTHRTHTTRHARVCTHVQSARCNARVCIYRTGRSNTHVMEACGSFDRWAELRTCNGYVESDCDGFSEIN